MSLVYLGLGSNVGSRLVNITRAIEHLEQSGLIVQKKSSIIETDPVGGPPNQNKYLNAVVEIETILSPDNLLDTILKIEKKLGRIRSVRNAPRTIDIDILLYDDVLMSRKNLTIPHPRMFERSFVLIPLKEIAPHILVKHKTCEQLPQ